MVLAQDPGGAEEVAAGGGVGCAIGRQAVSLRQEGVSNKGTQQSPKAHKEMENLEGKRGMGRGMVQASYPIPHLVSHLGSPCLAREGCKGVGGRRGEE